MKRWYMALGAVGVVLLFVLAGIAVHFQKRRAREVSLVRALAAGDPAEVRLVLRWDPDQLNQLAERDDVKLRGLPRPMRLSVTPLAIAVDGGQREVVESLLNRGADVNAKISFGWTPLHLAPNAEIGQLLLAAGAAVDPVDDDGLTPLHHAARRGDTAFVRVLLGARADVRRPAGDGQTALHLAAAVGHRATVAALLAVGADPNAESRAGWTPLFKTADADIVRQLIAAGAKVQFIANGTTALHEAATADVARVLLGAGALLNIRDSIGGTPLHEAATRNRLDVAGVLLEAGAGVNLRDQNQQTVLDRAQANAASPALLALLQRYHAKPAAQLTPDE